jgi:hypothetical protein
MSTRRLAFILALPVAASLAFAQEPPPPNPGPPDPPPGQQPGQQPPAQQPDTGSQPAGEPETTSTREIPAEVVATDAGAKTIDVKVMIRSDPSAEPEEKQAKIRVDEEAVADLSTVKPGDKVKLMCRMNGNSVIAVKDIEADKKEGTEAPPQR